jgi:hypothetical protein
LANDAVAGDVVILRNDLIEVARTVLTEADITAAHADLTVRADAALATGIVYTLRASVVDQSGVEGLASVARWVAVTDNEMINVWKPTAPTGFVPSAFIRYAELAPDASGYESEIDRILTNQSRPVVRINIGRGASVGDWIELAQSAGVASARVILTQSHIDAGHIDIQTTRDFTGAIWARWQESGLPREARLERYITVETVIPTTSNVRISIDSGDGKGLTTSTAVTGKSTGFTLYAEANASAAYVKFFAKGTGPEVLLGIGQGRGDRYYSMTYDGPALAAGSYVIRAIAVDAAGNQSADNTNTYCTWSVVWRLCALSDTTLCCGILI